MFRDAPYMHLNELLQLRRSSISLEGEQERENCLFVNEKYVLHLNSVFSLAKV